MTHSTHAAQPLRWTVYRVVMFAAAASLAVYVPYKYATQLHYINGLYAFLFPLAALLAVAGIVFALRPNLVFRLSPGLRAALAAIGVAWLATGCLCVPSLTARIMATPAAGLFAAFHMTVQHLVLSVQVTALAVAPVWLLGRMGVDVPPEAGVVGDPAPVPAEID